MIICTNFNDQISISKAKEKMQMIFVFLVLLIDTAKKMFFSHSSHLWLFCYPMDCSPPGSSVNGILQAKILEWVAIPFSRLIHLVMFNLESSSSILYILLFGGEFKLFSNKSKFCGRIEAGNTLSMLGILLTVK